MGYLKQPSADADKFMLRLPDGLHPRLKEAAEANNRSLNAEIVTRLNASLERPIGLNESVAALIEAHVQEQVQFRLKAIAEQIGASS